VSDRLGNLELPGAVTRTLTRCFARARAALPQNIVTGDGITLHPPEITKGEVAPDQEATLLETWPLSQRTYAARRRELSALG
jgi:hypothetical protein